jgi:hypothetical protein
MAATRGQQIQDRCHGDEMWHHFLRRLDREVGVKTRRSAAELTLESQPRDAMTLNK